MPTPIETQSRPDGTGQPSRSGASAPSRHPLPLASPAPNLSTLLIFAAVVLLVDALVGDKGFIQRMRARRQVEEAEVVDRRSEEAERAHARVHRRLKDDPSAIEAVAREEMGLIGQGELLFIVRDAQPAAVN